MIEMAPEGLNVALQRVRRSALTAEQVFRLWRCAIKDDERLVDEVIQKVYEHIVAFDRSRANCVMELIVRRHVTAHSAFQSLLKDMYAVSDDTPVLFTSYFATGGALDYYGG